MVSKIVLWSWAAVILIVFAFVAPRRRAVLVSYLGAYMFLPMDPVRINALFELSKGSVAGFGCLIGMALFDRPTLFRFRPKWYDFPMLFWCITPYFTSMTNSLGVVDGASSVSQQLVTWGIPYFIGRCYFNDWESFRELAIGIFISALIYIPFCLIEMKMSPIFHKWVYSKFAHAPNQEKRWGGFRPQVFMYSGLAVAMWMTTASVVGVWLWMTGALKQIKGIPMIAILPFLLGTAVLCKSGAALGFLCVGLASLFWIKYLRNPLPLIALLLIPPVYMYQRASQNWDGDWLKDQAYKYFGEERGKSFETRINAENALTDRASKAPNPLFGWGKWDKDDPMRTPWRIQRELLRRTAFGEEYVRLLDMAPTDGLWVISLGQFGLSGLISLTVVVLLPVVILWMRVPMRLWDHPVAGAAAAMAIMVGLHMSDNLLNGIPNPFYQLAAGGICGIAPSLRKLYKEQQAQARQGFGVVQAQSALPTAAARPMPAKPLADGFPGISGLRAPSASGRR